MKDKNIPHQKIEGLNENHIRSISTVLGLMEKNLCLIEMYIKGAPCGRMFKVVNKLTPTEKQNVLSAIKDLKDCIRKFADSFELQPLEENINGIIRGSFAIYWADICDLEPKKLNSYGLVGSNVIDTLNHFIEQLKNLLSVYR